MKPTTLSSWIRIATVALGLATVLNLGNSFFLTTIVMSMVVISLFEVASLVPCLGPALLPVDAKAIGLLYLFFERRGEPRPPL